MVLAGNTNATTFTLADNFEWAALGSTTIAGDFANLFNNVTSLFGNGVDNRLLGNRDDNVINGGAGNDTLAGYGGDDLLTGGLGADKFYLNLNLDPSAATGPVAGFGGQITDFNRTGNEGDKLVLNFKTSTGLDYAYSFNGTDINNVVGAPRAALTYDQTTGLLEIQFQQSSGSGWAFAADQTPDISYLITGATDSLAPILSASSSFEVVSTGMNHPMHNNGLWGQQA
jgi:Ca2+-binding RTX toxin-like protein